jgi:hypothetical protein
VTARSLEALIRLSQAHAKLHLADRVEVVDVAAASRWVGQEGLDFPVLAMAACRHFYDGSRSGKHERLAGPHKRAFFDGPNMFCSAALEAPVSLLCRCPACTLCMAADLFCLSVWQLTRFVVCCGTLFAL